MDEKIEKSFLDEYSDDFNEYIDNNRLSRWCKIPEYKELYDKISSIKLKYPKVIKFLEDRNFDTLSNEELQAVRDILILEHQIDSIEEKEIFKLGMKENYIYLQNMDMLKI